MNAERAHIEKADQVLQTVHEVVRLELHNSCPACTNHPGQKQGAASQLACRLVLEVDVNLAPSAKEAHKDSGARDSIPEIGCHANVCDQDKGVCGQKRNHEHLLKVGIGLLVLQDDQESDASLQADDGSLGVNVLG